MSAIERRLNKLEAQLTDLECGFVPNTQKWLEFWDHQIYKTMIGDGPSCPFTIEALRAVVAYSVRNPDCWFNRIPRHYDEDPDEVPITG